MYCDDYAVYVSNKVVRQTSEVNYQTLYIPHSSAVIYFSFNLFHAAPTRIDLYHEIMRQSLVTSLTFYTESTLMSLQALLDSSLRYCS